MKSLDGLLHPDSSQPAMVVRPTHPPHLPQYHSLRVFSRSPAVQDTVQHGKNTGVHTSARFLPTQQGMGHQSRNLQQSVGVGTAEGRVAGHPVDGNVACVPAVAACSDAHGTRVVVTQPLVGADHHLIGFLAEHDQGVTALLCGGGVDPVEKTTQGDPAVNRRFVHVQADVDHLDTAGFHGEVLDDAQPLGRYLRQGLSIIDEKRKARVLVNIVEKE